MDESILFFSRVSLSKFSLEALYNTGVSGVFILVCVWNVKGQFFPNRVVWQLDLATWLTRESESRANCLARLEVLSCNAPAGVTLQLPYTLYTCASFGDLPTASQSQDPVMRPCWVHTFELFFTLSHTLSLHDSHLNTSFLNAKLQANWHEIKPTKWLIKFNLTHV